MKAYLLICRAQILGRKLLFSHMLLNSVKVKLFSNANDTNTTNYY